MIVLMFALLAAALASGWEYGYGYDGDRYDGDRYYGDRYENENYGGNSYSRWGRYH